MSNHRVNVEYNVDGKRFGYPRPWQYRLATYDSGSTYLEAYSESKMIWTVMKRTAIYGIPV